MSGTASLTRFSRVAPSMTGMRMSQTITAGAGISCSMLSAIWPLFAVKTW